ncbi:DNA-directed RNA polymerase subunit L [Candidatus Micrarchaeota archaeon]|nr:DNA-directed RNA polymerase subunit L [Candidatus Micrarchaeota archaeon]
MEMELIRDDKTELEFRIKGEDHAFSNLLVHELLDDSEVEVAQYDLPHPQVGSPTFYVRVKKGSASSAVKRALQQIRETASSLQK